ncbi:MAG: adenylosuccinate synthase [Oligoflexia bacterium]|nr:adenylosuccinate synthase [Oligoflexia bacterium]MBF0364650.1 adenylosuccinate synthase [Oligoflexia bacterium]
MNVTAILGAQWGDEGKGKIIDYFVHHQEHQQEMVIRGQGGSNAGHTLIRDDGKKIVLRLLPTGIVSTKALNIIGHGVVLDPVSFLKEVREIREHGFEVSSKNLLLSERVHLTFPWHRLYDQQNNFVGTTGNGIGPTYSAKALRENIRLGDFIHSPTIAFEKMERLKKNFLATYKGNFEQAQFEEMYLKYKESILTLINDYSDLIQEVHPIIQSYLKSNKNILLEGAQGTLLDLDMGTYPFVTSSTTTLAGLCIGSGIAPNQINKSIGVFKAYVTRVGDGPFPTEDLGEYGKMLQEKGKEFGSVTGRPRRCGHLDLVLLKHACELNGFNELVMTKFDILSHFSQMKICDRYNEASSLFALNRLTPHYKTFNNPSENLNEIITFIEDFLQTKISLLSCGPKRDDLVKISRKREELKKSAH